MRTLVCIVGPTASGKTALAVSLALRFGGEVVGCDSVQVYRGLDIGSAKPTAEERRGVPHHMIDVASPEDGYTAGRYAREASAVLDDLFGRGVLPIVCGGTGLYLRALTSPLADIPDCPRLEHGPDAYEKLARVDPRTAARLAPGDRMRIGRALDVYAHTGVPLSDHHAATPARRYGELCIGLEWERDELYRRIDARVDRMLRQGLPDEVRALRARGIGRDAPAMGSLGYREIGAWLDGEIGLDEATALIKRNTRRYAKRQLTWFSGQHSTDWLNVENCEKKASLLIEKIQST